MSLNQSLRVSATGMNVERFRMDTISANIANANSMQTASDPAYRKRFVELSGGPDGVQVSRVVESNKDFRKVYDPQNPLADQDGYLVYSNVEPVEEMVDMLSASRSYEANIAAFNSAKGMIRNALSIGKV